MLHVAVLLKPYLDLILQGKKTIECRLTQTAREPFEAIEPGERIYFKQSAGPYGATAVAEHVIFEDNLTPSRVKQIKADYNDKICGDSPFWHAKRTSKYCTLVWLSEVRAIDTGPAIRPLQGVAWMILDEEPAWRRVDKTRRRAAELFDDSSRAKPQAANGSFFVEVTAGNLRNNSLYLTSVIDRFPKWTLGGKNKSEAAAPITLMLHEGPTVQTDIVGPRNMLRTRVWGKWFRKHGVRGGDRVVFSPMNEATYFVGLSRERDRGAARTLARGPAS